MLGHVDYMGVQDVVSGHSHSTKRGGSVSQVSVEVVHGKYLTESGWTRILRAGKRGVSLMKDFLPKFLKPGDLVFDAFARMPSTAKIGYWWTGAGDLWYAIRTVVAGKCR